MTRFKVTGGIARLGPGQVLSLAPAQIRSRIHALEPLPKGYDPKANDAAPIEVKSKASLEFKVGEVIGLPELPRHLREIVENLDAPAEAAAQPATRPQGAARAPGHHQPRR